MVFDIAAEKSYKLSEDDIGKYADFCKQHIEETYEFINQLVKGKHIFLCSPLNYSPYAFGDQTNLVPIIYKCEILDIKLDSIAIKDDSSFFNNGFDMRIKDKYIMEIEKLSGDQSELHIELFTDELLRLKNRGSIIDYYGDILSITPEKAAEDLKKYFG